MWRELIKFLEAEHSRCEGNGFFVDDETFRMYKAGLLPEFWCRSAAVDAPVGNLLFRGKWVASVGGVE